MQSVLTSTLLKSPKAWFGLSFIVIILDQYTKWLADSQLILYEQVPVIPFFNIKLAYNPGAAFSILSDASGWQRWFFIITTLIISVILIVWLIRQPSKARWTPAALALILGGAIGNLIDRILYGHVIDFLDVYIGEYHWPTFNIADSAVTVGAVILISISLFEKNPDKTL